MKKLNLSFLIFLVSISMVIQSCSQELKLSDAEVVTITYETEFGTKPKSIVVKKDTILKAEHLPNIIAVGYSFEGWYEGTTKIQEGKYKITSDVTFVALWKPNTNTVYKVEYYQQNLENNDYTIFETITYYGTTGELTNPPVKTFTGFMAKEFEPLKISAEETTILKIYYDRNIYSITFDARGGVLTNESTEFVKYEGKIYPKTNPLREGYSFNGWYISYDDGETLSSSTFDFNTAIKEDIKLYAKWTPLLQSIEITRPPYKNLYLVGDSIDTTGLTVIAVYTDGSTKNISNWTLENLVADSVGESKEINILYEEDNISKSTNFTVNVFETDVLLVSFIFKEKEYNAVENNVIIVDKLDIEEGSKIDIDTVVLVRDRNIVILGDPYVKGAKINCVVLGDYQDKYTILRIESIVLA